MSRLSALARAAAALALCGPAPGQQVIFPLGELIQMELPVALEGPFRNSVAGHFTRLHCNDAVVLVDQTASMVHAPGIHRSAYALPMPATLPAGFDPNDVNDIVTVPHGRIAEHDALALVTGGGLWLWTYEVDNQNEWSPQVVKLGGSAWNGALKLRCADVDGDGNWDILGLMSNGSSIRCYRRGSPPPAGWVMHLGGPVRDFAIFDFVPGGTPEVVALTGELERREGENTIFVPPGLRAYSTTDGSLLFEQNLANDRGVVLPWMHTIGEPPTDEARVIVATTAGATHAVQSFTTTGSAFVGHGSYALTDEATALAVGRFQSSPVDQLLATLRHEGQPVKIGTDATGAFIGTSTIAIGPTNLPAGVENFAQPVLVDFHGAPYAAAAEEHTPKLLYPSNSLGTLAYQQEVAFPAPFFRPSEESAYPHFQVDLSSKPAEATHAELISWPMQLSTTTTLGTLDPEAVQRLEFDANGDCIGGLTLPHSGGYLWCSTIRFVEMDGDTVVRRWPARVMLFGEPLVLEDLVQVMELMLIPCPPRKLIEAVMHLGAGVFLGLSGDHTDPPSAPPSGSGTVPPPPPPPPPPPGG